jgi:membrane fusion protein (multidrug efflux system)
MNADSKMTMQSSTNADFAPPPKKALRRVLMLFIPLVLVAGGVTWYLLGGRYVSTDNAYVKADIASISPEISGNVTAVLAKENQLVKKGDPILTIDDTNYRIGLAGSGAQLKNVIATIESDKARFRQKEASIALQRNNVAFAQREYDRQASLAKSNYASASKLDQAKLQLDTARQNIALLRQEEAEILARLQGDINITPEQVPAYQQAYASKLSAEVMMKRATLYAPFDGIVSQLPKVGDFARTGAPVFSIVSSDEVWIEANFKETDLTHMIVGQPVEIEVDTYPGRPFKGHVTSISQATGAEFSVLPAQNSTGNWIKVVQRIPVRISVDDQKTGPALRSGMSVEADVDTGRNRLEQMK